MEKNLIFTVNVTARFKDEKGVEVGNLDTPNYKVFNSAETAEKYLYKLLGDVRKEDDTIIAKKVKYDEDRNGLVKANINLTIEQDTSSMHQGRYLHLNISIDRGEFSEVNDKVDELSEIYTATFCG
jgi:hypothetical protein